MPATSIINGLTHAEYAQLGAEIDCDATPSQLERFARKFGTSTDGDMRALATYASFKFRAVRARLEGRIQDALAHEANCTATILFDIHPANRW